MEKSEEEIYQQFKDGKRICGVKDPNMNIYFSKKNDIGLLIAIILIFLGWRCSNPFTSSKVAIYVIFLGIGLLICSVLMEKHRLYLEEDNLIVKNRLGRKIVFFTNQFPIIYCQKKEFESYNEYNQRPRILKFYKIYIRQRNKKFRFTVNKDLNFILDNLIFESKE